jgi:hypothetical protein
MRKPHQECFSAVAMMHLANSWMTTIKSIYVLDGVSRSRRVGTGNKNIAIIGEKIVREEGGRQRNLIFIFLFIQIFYSFSFLPSSRAIYYIYKVLFDLIILFGKYQVVVSKYLLSINL